MGENVDTNSIMLFVLGLVLGSVIVMLLWMSSPGNMMISDVFSTDESSEMQELTAHTNHTGTLLWSESSGARMMTTGERGTRSTFIDSYGNQRNMVCYTSVYCIDETECDPCDKDECVDNGMKCGYWPGQTGTLAANVQNQGIDYGKCCAPYQCVDGYCAPDEGCIDTGEKCRTDKDCCEGTCYDGVCTQEEECVETGATCGYVSSNTMTHATTPTYYGECCPPDECVDNVCTSGECQDYDELCGVVRDEMATTMSHVSTTDYGECCAPYSCIDNHCKETTNVCQNESQSCGVVKYMTGSTTVENDLGVCCEPFLCIDNVCTKETQECSDYGEVCKSDEECCEGTYCSDNVCSDCKTSGSCTPGAGTCCGGYKCWDFTCVEEKTCKDSGKKCDTTSDCCEGLSCNEGVCKGCASTGDTCGEYANGLECCTGAYCYMGICEKNTEHVCADTETGPDYYSKGTARGDFNGKYGTYEDYCLNDKTVLDYYCQAEGEHSPVLSATLTCRNGCVGGACK